jgi:hypothetical protein
LTDDALVMSEVESVEHALGAVTAFSWYSVGQNELHRGQLHLEPLVVYLERVDELVPTVLQSAWSFAERDLALWKTELWPLIFRVETAHQEGDSDVYAEDELRVQVTNQHEAALFPCSLVKSVR